MLTATGRKYGSDTHQIPTGEDVLHNGVPWYVMLNDGRFKYIRPLVNDLEELYDLQEDPEEVTNLSQKPEQQQRLKKFRAMAIAKLKRTGSGFVDNMPKVRGEILVQVVTQSAAIVCQCFEVAGSRLCWR